MIKSAKEVTVSDVPKKILITILVLISAVCHLSFGSQSNESACLHFVSSEKNTKQAHTNIDCIKAAELGSGTAQYSIGLGYGFAGNAELEEKYYRLAANNRNIAAYLALGHLLRERNAWEAIYWYQRFASTKTNGYGYAALLISNIFKNLGESEQSAYWLDVCRASAYKGCEN